MDHPARLKSHIVVSAILRRAEIAGAHALVVKKGDADAGAIALKVYLGRIDGAPRARLLLQELDEEGAPAWSEPFDGAADEQQIDARLAKERRFDRDLWIVEVEDRAGRTFLAD
jgi:hypothetical protein